jgi:hypothetical protein
MTRISLNAEGTAQVALLKEEAEETDGNGRDTHSLVIAARRPIATQDDGGEGTLSLR